MGIKSKTLPISKNLKIIKKKCGWCFECPSLQNCCRTMHSSMKDIGKVLGQTDNGEDVLRLLKFTKIQHTYAVNSK
jgi:hypothetical protein